MFSYFKNLMLQYTTRKPSPSAADTQQILSENLAWNLNFFRDKFDGSADLTIREMEIEGVKAAVITIEGMVNKETLANAVINPMMRTFYSREDPIEKYEYIRDNVLSSSEQVEVGTFEEAFALVMSGFALIALDGCGVILAIGLQGFSFRSVSEPTNEVMEKGSKEGFVEPLRINMTLIRRRMKNPKMKFETMSVGSVSKTDVCLCYLRDTVSPEIIKEIKKRLKSSSLETVLSASYLIPFLEGERNLCMFPGIGLTERPDTVCGKIAEGRVALLVDGAPGVLIIPYLFVEYFQTMDDYSNRPYFATFTRWLKYLAFFIATFLPGIYVAMGTFNPEVFPEELMIKIAASIAVTPFPLMLETLVIHLIYEIMREAGLRLPKPLGHAVSIVGALVIGDTAISSGLIGATTLMVVALTAISSYVIPNLYEPIAILRLLSILAGGIMGIWGVMLLFSVLLVSICGKTTYGIPFLAPVSPFSLFSMRDVAIRCSWKVLSKRANSIQHMPGTAPEDREEETATDD